jgi:3-hydroxyacyl-CoA dehydrogenase
MSFRNPVRRIAIVGTGLIGASWAAQYLARGFDVIATDPAPNAEANLRKYVDEAWPALTDIGLSPGAARKRLVFTSNMKEALSTADFVQESGPERPDFKIKLFADMDDATPPDSIIASSSSGLTMTVIQSGCKRPERCVIGHPFNPPHIIPLVEVVGGARTSPEAIQQAMSFYSSIGKKPIYLRKEFSGHVANRLQAALYREVIYLIEQGVLSVADADDAVSWGPGLRWGVMGPSLLWHIGGGPRGIQHFMEHLMDPLTGLMKALGNPEVTKGNPSANDGSIERVDLDGQNRQTIIPEGATFTPKQMKLEKLGGKLYWSDREGMRVMRANLDGSNIETLVETGYSNRDRRDQRNWCVGIAVDAEGGKIYWTQKGPDNAGEGRIFRASLEIPNGETSANRTDIELLFAGLPEPIDLDLDLNNRMI